jgi:GH18 family chitinase
MIHLAHSANVQIYASITLSPSKLLGLDIGTFVTNAMSLLSTTNFDGLDIYITTSLDHVNEDTNSIVMALQSLLMVLQPELLSLMDNYGRTYGLSLVVLPSCDITTTTTDESVYTQDFINILKSVGELNLLSYNPPTTTNDDIVPTSNPILPTWQQPPTSTTINSTTTTTTTSKSNDNCQAIEESVAVWGSRGILPDKINVGLSTTTTDKTDVCEQVKYGISSGWNGYFLW